MTGALYPELTLGPLRWWDLPTVTAIEAELFPTDSPWTEAMFWSELARRHYYLACWDGLDLVGYAGLARHDEHAEVQTIGVRATHQGAGIGRRMLTALIAHAEGRPISLEVRTDNDSALSLYLSMGFEQVGRRRRYYQPSGADAYTMVRKS